ncbi:MAG: cation diffusion facilitator family transporter, partial [Cyanobacteria bacterium]|nr:cation diffusion facilitator family transporter [Cyanobacteriota bacterium]
MSHSHNHTHGHDHGHAHGAIAYDRIFRWGVGLNLVFVAVEAAVGLRLESLALLADAGHNLSDVLGLVLAWVAHYLGQKAPTPRYTYGWRRSSILAALLNSGLLLLAMGAIAWEAIQ